MSSKFEDLLNQSDDEARAAQIPFVVRSTKRQFAQEHDNLSLEIDRLEAAKAAQYRNVTQEAQLSIRQVASIIEAVNSAKELQTDLAAEYEDLFGASLVPAE